MEFALRWDWKEQPNWIEISAICQKIISAGYTTIFFNEIETGSDEYGLLISNAAYNDQTALEKWKELINRNRG